MEAHLTFSLKYSRLRISPATLRAIGKPDRICILLSEDRKRLLIVPHDNRDFLSHKVSRNVYIKGNQQDIHSKKLCTIIGRIHGWSLEKSYVVPGVINTEKKKAAFDLTSATELIGEIQNE